MMPSIYDTRDNLAKFLMTQFESVDLDTGTFQPDHLYVVTLPDDNREFCALAGSYKSVYGLNTDPTLNEPDMFARVNVYTYNWCTGRNVFVVPDEPYRLIMSWVPGSGKYEFPGYGQCKRVEAGSAVKIKIGDRLIEGIADASGDNFNFGSYRKMLPEWHLTVKLPDSTVYSWRQHVDGGELVFAADARM